MGLLRASIGSNNILHIILKSRYDVYIAKYGVYTFDSITDICQTYHIKHRYLSGYGHVSVYYLANYVVFTSVCNIII